MSLAESVASLAAATKLDKDFAAWLLKEVNLANLLQSILQMQVTSVGSALLQTPSYVYIKQDSDTQCPSYQNAVGPILCLPQLLSAWQCWVQTMTQCQ